MGARWWQWRPATTWPVQFLRRFQSTPNLHLQI